MNKSDIASQRRNRVGLDDTDAEARRVMIELARKMAIPEKVAQVVTITETMRTFASAGIRKRYPDASEEEIQRRLAAVLLDRETVIKVYGWDPKIEGY